MKLRKSIYLMLTLLVAFMLCFGVSCDGTTPPQDEVLDPEPTPEPTPGGDSELEGKAPQMTEASNAFTISGSRFKAEKAALAMYEYVIEHWSTLQEDGKVEVVDDAGYSGVSLGKGSYFSVSFEDDTSVTIDAKVNVIGPEKYTAILKATADNQSFDNLKVECFGLADEEGKLIEGASWKAVPAVFIAQSSDITSAITSFTSSSRARSISAASIIQEESYFNKYDGKGWFVYEDAEDGSRHKVNFMATDGNPTSYTLDGWCDVGGATQDSPEIAVSPYPAIKDDDAEMGDVEALKLGLAAYAYFYNLSTSMFVSQMQPEWLVVNMGEGEGTIEIKEHQEQDFFGSPMNVSGSIRIDMAGEQSSITLNGGWGELELVAAGDGSNSITGGEISSLDINGKSYSHLRDEMYLGCLRIFSSGELLVSLFDAIHDGIDYWWKGVSGPDGNGIYTFTDATPDYGYTESGATVFTADGTVAVKNGRCDIDLLIKEKTSSGDLITEMDVEASGKFDETTGRPTYEYLKYLNQDMECYAHELRLVNIITRDAVRKVSHQEFPQP